MLRMASVPTEFWIVVFGLLGAILGSYANMAAYRLPRGISTVKVRRSFCPSCQHQLAWYDNLPIVSFLLLRGRCRYCGQSIAVRYLLVELFVVALFVAAAWQFFKLNDALGREDSPAGGAMPAVVFLVQLFLIVDLVILAVADLETWLIPPQTTCLPWLPAGFVLALGCPALHPAASTWTHSPRLNALLDSFEGLVLGAGLPWAVGFLTVVWSFTRNRLRGIQARPLEGMGAGDSHLLGMIGALLGWKAAIATFLMGIFIGLLMGLGKIAWGRLQHWRLGGRYRPWQPAFDLPGDEGQPRPPAFWPLPALGILVLVAAGGLWQQSIDTFEGVMFPTVEDCQQPELFRFLAREQAFDARLAPVWAMLLIGVLLVLAYPFLKYLAATNNLPQGEIVVNEKGEKQEVMTQGNYIPFGPSLAAGALLIAFYDPLIRNFAFWWLVLGGEGHLPPLPYAMLGQNAVLGVLVAMVRRLNALSLWILEHPWALCLVALLPLLLLAALYVLIRTRDGEAVRK